MSIAELDEIIEQGCRRLQVGFERNAIGRIARLSEGLPYYAHLLALHATQRAVQDDRDTVQGPDVDWAVGQAVGKAQQTIQVAYQRAVQSPRTENQFEQVLLACALAEKDESGFFTASAVRAPLSAIMDRPREIPTYARHLNQFSQVGRGPVLRKTGSSRSYFYRFTNPLVQPFVILRGIAAGVASEATIRDLQERAGRSGGAEPSRATRRACFEPLG